MRLKDPRAMRASSGTASFLSTREATNVSQVGDHRAILLQRILSCLSRYNASPHHTLRSWREAVLISHRQFSSGRPMSTCALAGCRLAAERFASRRWLFRRRLCRCRHVDVVHHRFIPQIDAYECWRLLLRSRPADVS